MENLYTYLNPQNQISQVDGFDDVGLQYILRTGYHEDELGIVLKGHLIVEYLLNRIIRHGVGNSKKYLDLKFSKKVILLNEYKLLPIYLEQNINRLNSFRNNYAHSLDYEPSKQELVYTKTSGENISIKGKSYRGRYPQRHYYRVLVHSILTALTNHMLSILRVSPFWDKDGKIICNDVGFESSIIKNLYK